VRYENFGALLAGRLQLQFYLTKTVQAAESANEPRRRIMKDDLSAALQMLNSKDASCPPKVFLCGPPGMVDEVSRHLTQLGVDSCDVKFENWW